MTTLSELRQANLAEQKDQPVSVDTELRNSVSTQVRKPVRTQASTDVLTDASKYASTQARTDLPTEGLPQAPAEAATAGGDDPFLDRVREALARRTAHPGGVKATVEMPTDLSLRAKRYCLDHGGVPVRQVFLELMAAFLDAEGY